MHFFSRIFLPLLLFGYIATETYLKVKHTSLCGDVGCKLAGELLRFDALYLNYFALAGLFFLIILGSLSLKNKFFEVLFFMGLYAAIAFEATIISYQFIANPEPCLFCLSIFSSLLLIALFAHVKSFPLVLASIFALFMGLNTLAVTQNKSFVTAPGLYLIQSETCSHCKKVKQYFADNAITYTAISTKEVNARGFLKFVDISTIPVLIHKEASGITLLTGDTKIIAHFESEKKGEAPVTESPLETTQNNTLELSSDFLSAGGSNDGCALTIIETPSCEDENNTH